MSLFKAEHGCTIQEDVSRIKVTSTMVR